MEADLAFPHTPPTVPCWRSAHWSIQLIFRKCKDVKTLRRRPTSRTSQRINLTQAEQKARPQERNAQNLAGGRGLSRRAPRGGGREAARRPRSPTPARRGGSAAVPLPLLSVSQPSGLPRAHAAASSSPNATLRNRSLQLVWRRGPSPQGRDALSAPPCTPEVTCHRAAQRHAETAGDPPPQYKTMPSDLQRPALQVERGYGAWRPAGRGLELPDDFGMTKRGASVAVAGTSFPWCSQTWGKKCFLGAHLSGTSFASSTRTGAASIYRVVVRSKGNRDPCKGL